MKSLAPLLKSLSAFKFATPIMVLAMLSMIILPLPPAILDILFTFNIVLSVIVILVSVAVRRPIEFSVFPTIILATTLMRLTLNVASTRVVLLHGHEGTGAAGHVIESFGKVVIGGNFVVGLVVFIILMIINFVVVTKGAERISEVSARFTLDALPGKQMAIDADLNAGLITQEQAQVRRKDIATEADFYGAMDGASKFVRGDAVAGILILIINGLGGAAIGMLMHDLSFGDAFRQYALLTIGDGLVAQIPSLLLAAGAAIIVTRVSDAGDFEKQVGSQLLASPGVLYSAAAVMLILAIIPGMPWLVFAGFACLLAYVAWRVGKRRPAPSTEENMQAIESALRGTQPEEASWETISHVDPLGVRLGYRLVEMIDSNKGAPLLRRIQGMRRTLSDAMGFVVPRVVVRDDLSLPPSHYAILIHGVEVARAELYSDKLMAIPSPTVYGQIDGTPAVDPAYGMLVTWIEPDAKAHALGMGYQVVDCPSVVATHLDKTIREHLQELFSHDDVGALLERLAQCAPKLTEALEKVLTHNQLRKVFRTLLNDGVSVKNVVPIATTLLECAESTTDAVLLAAEVRCTLRREIVAAIAGQKADIPVFNLTGELEGMLMGALTQAQQTGKPSLDAFPIAPTLLTQLQIGMPSVLEQMKQRSAAAVLLVTPPLRPLLGRYARLFSPGLRVLSYTEIPEQRNVTIVGSLG